MFARPWALPFLDGKDHLLEPRAHVTPCLVLRQHTGHHYDLASHHINRDNASVLCDLNDCGVLHYSVWLVHCLMCSTKLMDEHDNTFRDTPRTP